MSVHVAAFAFYWREPKLIEFHIKHLTASPGHIGLRFSCARADHSLTSESSSISRELVPNKYD
jgi:hypothetical protein